MVKTITGIFIAACLCFGSATPVYADSVSTLLLPGKVIQGHAKYEGNCNNCHKKFDKAAQPDLCKDCHKEVAKDVDSQRGYHGMMEDDKECKECHTDHKGREAEIVKLKTGNFDHNQTDFVLKGGHLKQKVLCKDCHLPEKKYRDAPSKCFSCHKKDDKHKGRLGKDCENCHVEKDWKTTRYDHSKTDFPLLGKHADVKCKSCHINEKYKNTTKICFGCHRKDDAKTHKGKFGARCETCHTAKDWKDIVFDHGKTKFPLLGKHRPPVKCSACHKGVLYKEKLKLTCVSCHKKEDSKAHKRKFGAKCESCHTEKDWKKILFDHDRDTKYRLRGKHRDAKCVSCHKGVLYKEKLKTDCYSCHRKDDKHKGQEGKKCETCHSEQSWTKTRFDHRMSRFPLTGKHLLTECKKCHATVKYKDAKTDCWSCHKKEDTHKLTLGKNCESCHNTRDWKSWDFDHDKTDFKLEGKHKKIRCSECHNTPVSKKMSLPVDCSGCHRKDDKHDGAYGSKCENCHTGLSWKDIKVGSNKWLRR